MDRSALTSVQVIIPCLNEEAYIGGCLQSLVDADQPAGGLQVSVVDGRSDDRTREIIAQFSQQYDFIELIDNPERVTPIAMNKGLEACRSDAFVILGGHAEIDAQFLVRGLEQLNANPEVGCVGGFIENVYETDTAAIIGKAMSSRVGVGNAHFRTGTAVGYVDTVAFGMYPISIIKEIGPFDPVLARNQDDEFNYRVTKAGYKVLLDPEIKSRYFVRGTLKRLFKQYFQYGYWKVYVNKKHSTITTLRQLAPPIFVGYTMASWAVLTVAMFFTKGQPSDFLMLAFILPVSLYFMVIQFTAVRIMGLIVFGRNKLVLAFLALHFGYGLGYLKGLLYFYLFRVKPKSQFESLSR